jgi:hypothetical protein
VAAVITQGEGQSPDLRVAYRLLAAGIARSPSPGQGRQDGVGKRAAGELALSVLAAEQQHAQSIGLCGTGRGQFLSGDQQ